jgi:HPt (histidine-containing phosphotransfer) domain-containing protein
MPDQRPPNPALADLAASLGERDARKVVRVFLQTFPAMLHDLSRGDATRSRRAAHGLKSSARQMGADALADRMADLERRLAVPNSRVTTEDLTAAARDFTEAAGPLRSFAAGQPARP